MPPVTDGYDLFVSYAREDNRDGWISRFVERLLAEHQRVTAGRPPLKPFFDTHDIRGLDDWRLRIHDSLAQSWLLLAFVSPTYFTRPWCRREWRTWIDHEIAQHILSSGAAPIHMVEVPGLTHESDERQVARAVAALCRLAPPHEPFVAEAAPVAPEPGLVCGVAASNTANSLGERAVLALAVSRRIGAYRVASGVLPPGLVQQPFGGIGLDHRLAVHGFAGVGQDLNCGLELAEPLGRAAGGAFLAGVFFVVGLVALPVFRACFAVVFFDRLPMGRPLRA